MRKVKTRVLCAVLILGCSFMAARIARADAVTDTLSVCVGYTGMDLTEYITVGTYHWGELEQNLPIYEQAYSYYSEGDGPTEYNAIVDAAHGFLLTDLLHYANIYYGDIYNLLFYVVDAQGIWTTFDKDALFANRYYFDDLAGHRQILYGVKADGTPDYTTITGYSFDQAWEAAEPVEPMLALEDNWASFNQEFEHIGPDYSYMGTGSRFRLLFGQQYPTESLTRESAKYVSRVYVTLRGKPSIGELPEELDGTLGSHEVTLTISEIYNGDMRDALSEYLKLNSTDDEVLRIDGIEVIRTEYSDQAKLRVLYTVLKEGRAALTAGIGSMELTDSAGQTLSQLTEVITGPAESPAAPADPEDPQETPAETNPEGSKPAGEENGGNEAAGSPGETKAPGVEETSGASSGDQAENPGRTETVSPETTPAEPAGQLSPVIPDEGEVPEEPEPEGQEISSVTGIYELSGKALEQLAGLKEAPIITETPKTEITEVKQPETSEDEEGTLLLLTGLGFLGICLLGAGFEFLSFRLRLKPKKIK